MLKGQIKEKQNTTLFYKLETFHGEPLNLIHVSYKCWKAHLIMREAGTVIVSLVSSSITSFRRITTWEEPVYPSESMLFLQIPLPSHCQIEAALQWEPTTDETMKS